MTPTTTTPRTNPVVLIVEDDARNADLVRIMLKQAGIKEIVICRVGKDIISATQPYPKVDMVLLDISLPEENGFQIFERLRQLTTFKESVIVATTGMVMPQEVARADEMGFDGFLGKPFHFDRFVDQIKRLLAGERIWEPRW